MNKKLTFLSVLTILLVSACSTTISSSSTITSSNQITSSISTNNVEVVNNNQESNIIAIEVEKLPSKLVYTSNEVISTQGGQLRVVYADYRVKFVPITDNMIDTSRLDTSRVGTTNITLKYQEGEQVLFTRYQVSIVPFKVSLTGVEIDIKESDVLFEQSVDLNYIISPSNAIYEAVVWSSSDERIARVDNNGVVTPLNQGEVVITVTLDGKLSATSKLNILPMQPKEVEVNPTYVNLISQGWIPLSNATDLATIDNDLTATSYTFAQFTNYATTISNLNAASMLDKNYFLINDIDLSSIANWTPLGTFTGELDGQGYAVKNLVINRTINNTGLFSILDGATIRNLNFNNAKINFNQTVANDNNLLGAGLLAGQVNATSSNNNIYNVSTDANSYVYFSRYVGGIIGRIESGQTNKTIINNVINRANIVSSSTSTGVRMAGIVGYAFNSKLEITNAINYGNVTGLIVSASSSRIGGIVGDLTSTNIAHSFVSNSKNYGVIQSYSRAGGIVGNLDKSVVRNSSNYGEIKSVDQNGGVVGWAGQSLIEKVFNEGLINSTGVEVGGLVGTLTSSDLENSFNKGVVKATGIAGGIAGAIATISTLLSPSNASITNTYNLGEVITTSNVNTTTGTGGIVGRTVRTATTNIILLKNNYNKGILTANFNNTDLFYGGLIGAFATASGATGSIDFLRNYFLNTTVANDRAVGNNTIVSDDRKMITISEIKIKATFVDWPFEAGNPPVWGIDPNINDGSPYLLWQLND